MKCYFQGCDQKGMTKEHIPPRSFFPKDERNQLLTVKSCEKHNNDKAKDDIYVLAQICMNVSPYNRSREIWNKKVKPQLEFNDGALSKMLAKDAVQNGDGSVEYEVDTNRFDEFFTALSCGLIFKACGKTLPEDYKLGHIYHNFSKSVDSEFDDFQVHVEEFYKEKPMSLMDFGNPDSKNERIYSVKIFGMPDFKSSITIVHLFFGKFKVTSMLSKLSNIFDESK